MLLLIASFVIWFPAGWFQGYGGGDLITVGDIKIGPAATICAPSRRCCGP